MTWTFQPMDHAAAEAIVTWRYEPPYDLYNLDPAGCADLLRPDYRYYAAAGPDGTLAGYCCFGADARVPGGDYVEDALDLGIGLRPELTGHGHGGGFLAAVLDLAAREFDPHAYRTTVAAFNARSLRMCVRAGFAEAGRFTRPGDGMAFVILGRPASSRPRGGDILGPTA